MVRSPLTNALLVLDAVTIAIQIVIAGKALIEERRVLAAFSAFRLFHHSLLSGSRTNSIYKFSYTTAGQ